MIVQGGRRGSWSVLALALEACASAAQSPKRWQPELTPELRESCKKAPLECGQAAETLAAGWTTDDEAFGGPPGIRRRMPGRGRQVLRGHRPAFHPGAISKETSGPGVPESGPRQAASMNVGGLLYVHPDRCGDQLHRGTPGPGAGRALPLEVAIRGRRRASSASLDRYWVPSGSLPSARSTRT
jgi:hypothetical protein